MVNLEGGHGRWGVLHMLETEGCALSSCPLSRYWMVVSYLCLMELPRSLRGICGDQRGTDSVSAWEKRGERSICYPGKEVTGFYLAGAEKGCSELRKDYQSHLLSHTDSCKVYWAESLGVLEGKSHIFPGFYLQGGQCVSGHRTWLLQTPRGGGQVALSLYGCG